ncbi:MAG: hypothetical protein ACXABO_07095 [Promethearchaeota archaeon]|jgi:hypothetical protein
MNELTVLMHILSKKSNKAQIGATEEKILDALNIKNRYKSNYFHELLGNLSRYVAPIGLQVKFNSLNSHWYLSFDLETTEMVSSNPFEGKPRLAATLFSILVCCFNNSGVATIQKIRELRKKKGIIEDLKELETKGFITIERNTNLVKLTPLIGYLLDLEKLLLKIAVKMKNEKL